jgi:hypothetical protein
MPPLDLRSALVLAAVEIIGLFAIVRGYLKWSGRHRRWYRTSTLGERLLMGTIFGGGPLIEILLGLGLTLVAPLVLTIHYGLYSAGYIFIGATWVTLGLIAYLYTARPDWAIPRWMKEEKGRPGGSSR